MPQKRSEFLLRSDGRKALITLRSLYQYSTSKYTNMKSIVLCFLTFATITSFGQQMINQEKIVCLDTSEIMSLPTLDDDLSRSRIVLIGEAGHGDGRTFEMKGNLIKYLISKHGFNVVALEGAGFVETPYGLNGIRNDSNVYKEFEKFLDLQWSTSEQMKPLIQYLSDGYKKNEIDIYGFDPQVYATSYTDKLYTYLDEERFHCLANVDKEKHKKYVQSLKEYFKPLAGNLSYDEIVQLDSITSTYLMQVNAECHYYKQLLINMQSCLKQYVYNYQEMAYADRSVNSRDSVMALNIFYYLSKNPNAKMIVSAANFHIIKDLSLIVNDYDSLKYRKIIPMGNHVFRKFPKESFAIAFTNLAGKQGICIDTVVYDIQQNSKYAIDENTIESSFMNKSCELSFVNLKKYRLSKTTNKRSLLFGGNMHKGSWDKAYDCIFYIEKQTPSTLRKP